MSEGGRSRRIVGVPGVIPAAAACLILARPLAAAAGPVDECEARVQTQVQVSGCLAADLRAAEQVLSTALAEAGRVASDLDRTTGRPGAREAVEAAQRRWLDFREANCAVRAALAAGGSGSDQFALGCRIEMTRARARELLALAHGVW
jgi:uncharacterized protein YecT (DUF1311 family)